MNIAAGIVRSAELGDEKEDEVHAMLLNVVRSLVDRPEDVHVTPTRSATSVTFQVQAHPADMGKLIGVNGRTARALRVILGANAARLKRNLSLDILQASPVLMRSDDLTSG